MKAVVHIVNVMHCITVREKTCGLLSHMKWETFREQSLDDVVKTYLTNSIDLIITDDVNLLTSLQDNEIGVPVILINELKISEREEEALIHTGYRDVFEAEYSARHFKAVVNQITTTGERL